MRKIIVPWIARCVGCEDELNNDNIRLLIVEDNRGKYPLYTHASCLQCSIDKIQEDETVWGVDVYESDEDWDNIYKRQKINQTCNS